MSGFCGWLKVLGSPWDKVCAADTEGGCRERLAKVRRDLSDVVSGPDNREYRKRLRCLEAVLPAGQHPDGEPTYTRADLDAARAAGVAAGRAERDDRVEQLRRAAGDAAEKIRMSYDAWARQEAERVNRELAAHARRAAKEAEDQARAVVAEQVAAAERRGYEQGFAAGSAAAAPSARADGYRRGAAEAAKVHYARGHADGEQAGATKARQFYEKPRHRLAFSRS